MGSNCTLPAVNATQNGRFHSPWIIGTVVNLFSYVFLIWLSVGLMIFGTRRGRWGHLKEKDLVKRNSGIVFLMAVIPFFTAFLVVIAATVFNNMGFEPRVTWFECETAFDTMMALYYFLTCLVNIFFWKRQRVLYQHPMMSDIAKKPVVRVINGSILVLFITGFIVMIIGFNYFCRTFSMGEGCQTLPMAGDNLWPLPVGLGSGIVGQLLIMGLFIYPMKLSSNRMRMKQLFQRTAAITTAVYFSICGSLLVILFVNMGKTLHFMAVVGEINLMFIMFCIVLSFDAWKTILKCGVGEKKNQSMTSFRELSQRNCESSREKIKSTKA